MTTTIEHTADHTVDLTVDLTTSEPRVDASSSRAAPSRAGGVLAIVGALTMAIGGMLYSVAGADLWGLVDGDTDVNGYLADAAASVSTLHATHAVWITGVLAVALGGVLLVRGQSDAASIAARATYIIGVALSIPAYLFMVALTRLAESGTDTPELVEALAFMGARLDDIATIVIIGLGPLLITLASHKTWMPRWLAGLGVACAATGLLSAISLFLGGAGTYGFIIVPVGVVFMVAAGVVTVRDA